MWTDCYIQKNFYVEDLQVCGSSSGYGKNCEYSKEIAVTYLYLIVELTKFGLILLNAFADLYLIFLIVRFKKLRTKYNEYIFHFAIFHLFYHTSQPIFFMFHAVFVQGEYNFNFLVYYGEVLEKTTLVVSLSILLILSLDCIILPIESMQNKNIYTFIPKVIYKFKFVLLYLITITILKLSYHECLVKIGALHHFLYGIFLGIPSLFLICTQYFYKNSTNFNEKHKYFIIISQIATVCYLPSIFITEFDMYKFYTLIHFVCTIPVSVVTFILIYYLYHYDNLFKYYINNCCITKIAGFIGYLDILLEEPVKFELNSSQKMENSLQDPLNALEIVESHSLI